ncbi:GNAT family N-acetyltransferase [Clostridium tagluense]|uniref:GNAT family N-acetyltransferase n=2 Tax=Clostridium tagluense TaxID=360422 RepID=UPI001C0D9FBE|nr:GNAT family protein [Clostridium tagluense]MBU3127858.1 GNAT family N-acetyltransferase [Clostridium tagluense]
MRKRKNTKVREIKGGNYRNMSSNIFSSFPKIITKRLVLREITEQDAESIYKLLSNPEVIKYDTFELFTDIKQAEDLIECFNEAFRQKRAIFWGISLKNESQIIGFCKCEIEIPKIRADLGYDLRPEYWNRGIMTEALDAVIDFTFNKADVNRIEASVSNENNASIRVLEKLGFIKEGVLRKRSYWGGSYRDMVMLSILKNEY